MAGSEMILSNGAYQKGTIRPELVEGAEFFADFLSMIFLKINPKISFFAPRHQ